MIEKAYFIKHFDDLNNLPPDTNRLYLGSDYCIKAYPQRFADLVLKAKDTYPVTLLIPPIIESELNRLEEYLKTFIDLSGEGDEIIFNDLGALYFTLSAKEKKFKIGLGRYYSYQKRGVQNLYDAIKPEDLKDIPILDEYTLSFLKDLGIERIEIDSTPYGLNFGDSLNIKISLYEDNILTSYTINCPYTFNGKFWDRNCKRECLNSFMIIGSEENLSDFYEVGKAYYQDGTPLNNHHIDRLVRFRWKNP